MKLSSHKNFDQNTFRDQRFDRRRRSATDQRKGFTLMEIILYVSIFAIIGGLLINILVSTLRVHTTSQSARVVSEEGRFVVQFVERLVRESSLIDMSTTTSQGTLALRMNDSVNNRDFVRVFASGTKIYVAEGMLDSAGASSTCPSVALPVCALTTLTDDNVSADSLTFRRYSNAPGHDTLQIDFTLSYLTDKAQAKFNKTFRTAIARVSAAVFDSSLLPNLGSNFDVGGSGQKWSNGFFSGNLNVDGALTVLGNSTIGTGSNSFKINTSNGRVGIGTTNPTKPLHVANGEIYISTANEGLILKSSGGNCFKITISDTGGIATSTVNPCP